MILAIDLGGTHVRMACGDGAGEWRHSHHVRRPAGMDAAGLIAAAWAALADWGVAEEDLSGIGVSAAAVVDGEGTILRAENLGWQDVPLARRLREAFGVPVAVETDVFCGALFEARLGQARGLGSALYVAIGTGVGHAFVVAGRVWRGSAGGANALGHMVIQRNGIRCYCGNAGCLCTIASGRAQSSEAAPGGALEALAQAIGGALTLVEPERVILAGGALAQPWFNRARLEALLPRFSYPGLVLPKLVASDVADPNLRGAALHLKERQ
jgi:glucokinase